MQIGSDIGEVIGRIQEIQTRIADITSQPPTGAPTFGDALDAAVAAAPAKAGRQSIPPAEPLKLLDPAGNSVRPIAMPDSGDYTSLIQQSAQKYGVDPALVRAVINTESSGNPRAVSKAGAMGLMQLMPSNVTESGVSDPFDPAQNIDAGTHQLSDLLSQFNGDTDLALAAYNAGPGAVKRYGGVPPYPETRNYIQKIHGEMEGK